MTTTTTESKDPAGRVTQAELARRLKVSRPSVSKAVKAGRITPDDEGLFDPVAAELEWLANTRPKAQGISSKARAASGGYAQARTRKETALARMAELRLAQVEGALLPKEACDYAMSAFATSTRRLLEEFPARYGPVLAGIPDLAKMVEALDEGMRETQNAIADEMKRRADELRELSAGKR